MYNIFECVNQACRLRFPGSEDYPKSQRCPKCRSSIHIVATIPNTGEYWSDIRIGNHWQVETMLDNIRSTWNVGSIFRTADGTGIQKLYMCGITPTPENSRVSRTALGAENNIPWEQHNNGVLLAKELKSKGYTLWALEDLPGAIPLFDTQVNIVNSPLVIVLGNEITGIDPGIIELCDKTISIPMLGKKRSYNVAVAFGIAAGFLLYFQSVSQGSRKMLPNT
jgi:23S rRNA (guanosine2251-2'-O)-methyltransferase